MTCQVYTCGKCGEATQLDASSIIELQRVYAQLKVIFMKVLG